MEKAININMLQANSYSLSPEPRADVRVLVPAAYTLQHHAHELARDKQGMARYVSPSLLVSLLLHTILLGTFAWLSHKAPLPPLEEMPITVSLLRDVPEAPIVDEQPKPVKQQAIPKQRPQEIVKPQSQQPVFDQPITKAVTEAPSPIVAAEPLAALAPNKQESVIESKPLEALAKAAEKPTPKEDITEPPKFGVAYLNNPKPKYPRLSKSAGEEGRVLFKVLVNENGDPESIEMTTSSGFERLDAAALEAVQQWKFVPAKRNNQAISAYVTVPINFKLD